MGAGESATCMRLRLPTSKDVLTGENAGRDSCLFTMAFTYARTRVQSHTKKTTPTCSYDTADRGAVWGRMKREVCPTVSLCPSLRLFVGLATNPRRDGNCPFPRAETAHAPGMTSHQVGLMTSPAPTGHTSLMTTLRPQPNARPPLRQHGCLLTLLSPILLHPRSLPPALSHQSRPPPRRSNDGFFPVCSAEMRIVMRERTRKTGKSRIVPMQEAF